MGGGALGGGDWSHEDNALYVGGLPPDTMNIDLYEVFNAFGPIPFKGVKALADKEGQCIGYGFVNFIQGPEGKKAVDHAIANLNGTILGNGRILRVSYANTSKKVKETRAAQEEKEMAK